MDAFWSLLAGFGVALRPANLLFALVGSVIGTAVGVLPGIGPIAASRSSSRCRSSSTRPARSSCSRRSTTAPCTGARSPPSSCASPARPPPPSPPSTATRWPGRDGPAPRWRSPRSARSSAAPWPPWSWSSRPPLARVALSFGPPEFFALMVLGLALVVGLSGGSLLTGLLSALLGLRALGPRRGPRRGHAPAHVRHPRPPRRDQLRAGHHGALRHRRDPRQPGRAGGADRPARVESTMLTRQDWADSAMPIARGTGIGILLGLIPGIGTILPTIISYAVEKRVSRHPERFGRGAIEGVAGPETTNNAYARRVDDSPLHARRARLPDPRRPAPEPS